MERGTTMWKRYVLFPLVLAGSLTNTRLPAQDANSQAPADQQVFRKEVNLVSIYFTVRDGKKQLTSELEQDTFRVFEDGKEQPIKFFAHHTDVVLNVAVLLDTGTNIAS